MALTMESQVLIDPDGAEAAAAEFHWLKLIELVSLAPLSVAENF